MAIYQDETVRLRKGDRVRITVEKDCECDRGWHPLDRAGEYVGTVHDVGDELFPCVPTIWLDGCGSVGLHHDDDRVTVLSRI